MNRHLAHLLSHLRARRALRTLARAAWLALAAVVVALAGHRLWGWSPWSGLPIAGALWLAGLAWALLPRGSVYRLARRLDAHLRLKDGMTTALEVSQKSESPTRVGRALLDDAAHTLHFLGRRITRRPALLWRDLLAFSTLMIAAAGLILLLVLDQGALSRAAQPLPPRGSEPTPVPLDQPQAVLGPPQAPPGAPDALGDLAGALRDEAATRGAAEALDRGDPGAAADALRQLADQVDQLSAQGRQSLADALRRAAGDVAGENPELAGALERAAAALESGSPSAAAQALQELAGQLDALSGEQPGDESAEAGAPSNAPEGSPSTQPGTQPPESVPGQTRANGQSSTRLGGGDSPLPLSSQPDEDTSPMPRGDQPLQLPSQPGDETAGSFTPAQGTRDIWQAGADLLRYPWELRSVVEAYFTR